MRHIFLFWILFRTHSKTFTDIVVSLQEEYWMARRGGVTGVPSAGPGGPMKIWSEKLAGDLLRASALRVQKRRGAAAGDARRRRINYLRGNKEEEKKEAEDEVEDPLIPRTLKQQIEWEEGSLSRWTNHIYCHSLANFPV